MDNSKKVPYFVIKLNEAFRLKKQKNKSFSLRAFAKCLSMNPGTLSAVLKGKRTISIVDAKTAVSVLNLSATEKAEFLKSVGDRLSYIDDSYQVDPKEYKVLFEEWEYFVLLAFLRKDSEGYGEMEISSRGGFSLERTRECLEFLKKMGLVEMVSEKWRRVHRNIHSTHDVPSSSVRKAHEHALTMAMKKLDLPVAVRDYSFLNINLDEKQFKKYKRLALKFRNDVFSLDSASTNGEVYRVSIQCFPLLERVNQGGKDA
ncbi:TIGR02147 family protein [Bdellovibrio sp.]|uniref:TIGR02147 family protein n=1 Tax=Bdellovibrio sp. TaxID=28201 RepID=UPI0039E5EC26